MTEMENHFIQNIQKAKLQFAEKYCFGNLDEQDLKILKAIYQNSEFKFFKGKEAGKFWQKVNTPEMK